MRRGHYLKLLLDTIGYYHLADRHPDEIDDIVLMAEHGMLTDSLASAYLLRIQPWVDAQKRCWNGLPRAPTQDEIGEFDVLLGDLVERHGVRVGIRFLDKVRHVLVSGATGSGKSTLLRRMIIAIAAACDQLGILFTILILDIKGDFIDIPQRLGRKRCRHYSVHDGFRIGFNPTVGFRNLTSWINQITRVISAHFGLLFSSSSLSAIIRFALPYLNSSPNRFVNWPSPSLILEILRRCPADVFAAKKQYKDALEQRMEYLTNNSGTLFDTRRGFDVNDLVNTHQSAVIDLTTLSPLLVHIVVDIICSQILFWRMYERITDDPLFFLFIDEADTLCSSHTANLYPEGYTELGHITKVGRQFNIYTDLAMTYLGDCSQFITSNATYHFNYNQSDPASSLESSRTLHLDRGGQALLGSLQPGECIFKESQGPCSHAMLMKTDYEEPSHLPRPETFDQLAYVPGKGLDDPEMQDLAEALDRHIAEHKAAKKRQSYQKQYCPSDFILRLLGLCYDDPFAPVARLFERIGKVRFSTQKRVRVELEEQQLAVFKEMRIGSANNLLMRLLPKTYELLQKPPLQIKGQGDMPHYFPANWIRLSKQRQGLKAYIEWLVPNTPHRADVAVEVGEQYDLFEIVATCTSNLAQSIKACFTDPQLVRSVTIITTQKTIAKKLAAKIAAEMPLFPYLDRVKFETIGPYLKDIWQ